MNTLEAVVFYTNNINNAIDFYSKQIGLRLESVTDDIYASFLFDNGVRLGIMKATEKREKPGAQTLILAVMDAEGEYEKAQTKGLLIYKELTEEPWALEFSILDPDGNKVEFVQSR